MGNTDYQGGDIDQDVTEEMDTHYEADHKTSGAAILYGVFALVVTLIVAAGLFFGGRAVYRALTGTSSDDVVEVDGQNGAGDAEANNQEQDGNDQTPGVSDNSNDSENGQADDGSESSRGIPSTGDNLPATGSPTGI